jgi:hypothetical protein
VRGEGDEEVSQPDLFDVGERSDSLPVVRDWWECCTPAHPGSGPHGKTCATCRHFTEYHCEPACFVMQADWDTWDWDVPINPEWPACSFYEPLASEFVPPGWPLHAVEASPLIAADYWLDVGNEQAAESLKELARR